MKPLFIQGHVGFGDQLYMRDVVRAVVEQNPERHHYISTPFPELYVPTGLAYPVKNNTHLRIQQRSVQTWQGRWYKMPSSYEVLDMTYYNRLYQEPRVNMVEALFNSAGLPDVKQGPEWVMRDHCRNIPEYTKYLRPVEKLLCDARDSKRQLAVFRIPTVRKEYLSPARDADWRYLARIVIGTRDRFFWIGVADTAEDQESISGHYVLDRQEQLHWIQIAELMHRAKAVLSPPGFMIPLANMTRSNAFFVFGGSLAPHWLFHPLAEAKSTGYAAPEPFCDCGSRTHSCLKTIEGDIVKRFLGHIDAHASGQRITVAAP